MYFDGKIKYGYGSLVVNNDFKMNLLCGPNIIINSSKIYRSMFEAHWKLYVVTNRF